MKMRLVLILLVLGGLITLNPGTGWAQSGAPMAGFVSDGDGRPVAGASIVLRGNGLTLNRHSNAAGRFSFGEVPVGSYEVEASAPAGTARLRLDAGASGAAITLVLLKTIALSRSVAVPVTRGSGTDVTLDQAQIAHSPASNSLPDLLLQLPGAARGANGVVHINGDHGDINYIVDGISIPQELNRQVGSEIDPADISFMDVIEGAYPARYGGRFAAVVNIDTKATNAPPGISVHSAAGSFGSLESIVDAHTNAGGGALSLTLRNRHTDRALDAPSFSAVHDRGSSTNQFLRYGRSFGNDFVLATISHTYQTFQIPNDAQSGQPAATDDNETQNDLFYNLQFHHALRGGGTATAALALKRSRIVDSNDPANDYRYSAISLAGDRTAADTIADIEVAQPQGRHAVRYGATYDVTGVNKRYSITLAPGNYFSAGPYTVTDAAPDTGHLEEAYVQDTWQMGRLWRLDYGVRSDSFQINSNEFRRGFSQISPRVKIARIFSPRADLYAFAGRFFTPFSLENVSPSAALLINEPNQTSLAPFDLLPERDTGLELGGHLPLGTGEIGLRVAQKHAVDLIDDTQVGTSMLHQDINYKYGSISTQSAYYQQPLSNSGRFYASLTHTRASNKGCETQLLAPCFGAPGDWTPADHDQRWDAAAGIQAGDGRGGWTALDGEYGSGLSSAYCAPAAGDCKVPPHLTFDLSKGIPLSRSATLTLRSWNIFNDRYRITYLNAQGNHMNAGRTFEIGVRVGTP